MINKIVTSGYFKLEDYSATFPQALHSIEQNKTDINLEIPAHFERDLIGNSEANLLVEANAIN